MVDSPSGDDIARVFSCAPKNARTDYMHIQGHVMLT